MDVKQLCGEVLQSHVFWRISKVHLQEGRLAVAAFFSNVKYSITGKLKGALCNFFMGPINRDRALDKLNSSLCECEF